MVLEEAGDPRGFLGSGQNGHAFSLAEPGPGDAPADVPVDSPVPRPGDRRHDIEPMRPPVIAPPVAEQPFTPRASAVFHLDPEAVPADFGAQGERATVPGGAVKDR